MRRFKEKQALIHASRINTIVYNLHARLLNLTDTIMCVLPPILPGGQYRIELREKYNEVRTSLLKK